MAVEQTSAELQSSIPGFVNAEKHLKHRVSWGPLLGNTKLVYHQKLMNSVQKVKFIPQNKYKHNDIFQLEMHQYEYLGI